MKRNTNPLISIVVPAYNSEKYIGETIDSVLSQTYGNFELLIVDDESNDKTPEIIKLYINKDSRIKYFKILHSGRPSVPLNKGIDFSHGEFIAFLDNDDLWDKHKLKEQIEYFNKNPDLVFVYSMSITFGDVSFFSPYYEVLPLNFKAARTYDELLKNGNSITASTVLVKKEKIIEAGKFDEDPKLITHDYDMWLRLSKLGNFGFIPRFHCRYRVHKAQLSQGWERKKERLNYLEKKRNIELPKYNFYRNKGFVFLLPRNIIHYLTYLWNSFNTFIKRNII